MSKRKVNKARVLIFILGVLIVSFIIFLLLKGINKVVIKQNYKYLANNQSEITLYTLDYNETLQIARGTKVEIIESITNENKEYYKIKYNNTEYLVFKENVVNSEDDIILEKEMYVRTPVTIYESEDSIKILGMAKKGEKLDIVGYNKVNEDGSISMYKIKYNDIEGYVYGKYLVNNKELSLVNYDEDGNYQIHKKRGDSFGGGDAGNLDYYPYEKAKFENNVMPDEVRALYLNSGVVSNVDAYIKIAKNSGINAFVVDIKDNTSPAYPAKAMQEYSITNYNKAINSYETYKKAIKKLKDEGFYVIGRITVFKDSYYAKDHPEDTIKDNNTNSSYNHDGSYWPSAFKRKVWEYNVKLAIESVQEMGFNEIQFDYVRFPDRTGNLEKKGVINFGNVYKEDKAQAIQQFVMYACDEIHKHNAYVSIDVFGESAHNYVTAYGQYWAAISNVADVISGMPYPDHFSAHEYGFNEVVWTIPYKLLNLWGNNFVMKRQKEIPTPAIVRTWIQTYDTYKNPKVIYDSYMIKEEIKGLYDAGLKGGFMTWNGSSNLSKYDSVKSAFGGNYQ
ncbi:MAG: putative glycoside hydrolase [Candidatus Faecisoma sp.]|nr:putative glycoside hydrolase [Acholeplasma sp.]MDY2892563.1 putative glycoside hydrolase [Candidatus Faecisoma sp.]